MRISSINLEAFHWFWGVRMVVWVDNPNSSKFRAAFLRYNISQVQLRKYQSIIRKKSETGGLQVHNYSMTTMNQKAILLPTKSNYWPDKFSIDLHCKTSESKQTLLNVKQTYTIRVKIANKCKNIASQIKWLLSKIITEMMNHLEFELVCFVTSLKKN